MQQFAANPAIYVVHPLLDVGHKRNQYRRCVRTMTEPTPSGIPPSVEGIVTRPSPFSIEETLPRLQEAIRSRKLNLFAHIDHSGEAKRVGLKMQEAHVLIFGNPKAGTPLTIASPPLALAVPLHAPDGQ